MNKNSGYSLKNLQSTLTGICSKILLGAQVSPNTNLVEIFDSLDSVEFIMDIEKEFNISISDSKANEFGYRNTLTVNDIILELKEYGIYDVSEMRNKKLIKIEQS